MTRAPAQLYIVELSSDMRHQRGGTIAKGNTKHQRPNGCQSPLAYVRTTSLREPAGINAVGVRDDIFLHPSIAAGHHDPPGNDSPHEKLQRDTPLVRVGRERLPHR